MAAVVALLLSSLLALSNNKVSNLQAQLNSTNATATVNSTTTTPTKQADWTVTTKMDTQETSNFQVDVSYPFLENADHQKTADDINSYIKNAILTYRTEVTSIDDSSSSLKPSLTLDYDVKFLSNNFISILISGSEYLGGAHPGAVYTAVNYDLKNNKELKLEDIFNSSSAYLTTLSTTTRTDLATILSIDVSDSVLVGGTAPSAANFRICYFSGTTSIEKMGIVFSEYQVAPYAAGSQQLKLM